MRTGNLQIAVAVEIGNLVQADEGPRAGRVERIDLAPVNHNILKAHPRFRLRIEEAHGHDVIPRGPHDQMTRRRRAAFHDVPPAQGFAKRPIISLGYGAGVDPDPRGDDRAIGGGVGDVGSAANAAAARNANSTGKLNLASVRATACLQAVPADALPDKPAVARVRVVALSWRCLLRLRFSGLSRCARPRSAWRSCFVR